MLNQTAHNGDLGFEQMLWAIEGVNCSFRGDLPCMFVSVNGPKGVLR